MIGKLGSLFAYVCVATVLSLLMGLGYALASGRLNKGKLDDIAAVISGVQHEQAKDVKTVKTDETSEQPSLDDIEQKRAVKTRDIEMRELSLTNGLNRVAYETAQLQGERAKYDQLRNQFNAQLDALLGTAQDQGAENLRLIWENIKPKQAKEQILQMIEANQENDVVKILSAMPIAKRAKIISEFKTDEEAKKLQRLLDLIRQGLPDAKLIQDTRDEVDKFNKNGK